jgi:predicted ATPase
MYLISNNELQENSILFWDEPEANLNPSLISTVIDVLITLAQKGVQIFIASHDYLVTNLLSLKSEYQSVLKNQEKAEIRFFGLQQGSEGIEHSEGPTLADLDTNSILDEYLKFYDKEQEYFEKTQN